MKKEMNNKGFSLVELIIVIAIMAILVVVLAPQYLKYVERSRNSTDLQNATEMVTAIQTYAADPEAPDAFASGNTFTIEVKPGGTTVADTKVQAALTNAAIDYSSISCKSKTKWNEYTISGTVKADGSIEITYSSAAGGTPNNEFSNAMKGKTAAAPADPES